MEYLQVALTSLFSIIVLYLLARLMGNKQISQLNLFDYINGITIGSIAAEMATELEHPTQALTAMVIYGLAAYLSSIITEKSLSARKALTGKSIPLMIDGVLYRENLKKAHLELSEFLAQCRVSGYFDLSQIHSAVFEQNGGISFLPRSTERPATPADMGLKPEQRALPCNLIMDGILMVENLKTTGHAPDWLEKQLHKQGYASASDVFLGVLHENDRLQLYPMIKREADTDPFQ